jgi:calcineurin-like phosphoesterase
MSTVLKIHPPLSAICIVKKENYQYPSKMNTSYDNIEILITSLKLILEHEQMGIKLHLDLNYEKKSLAFRLQSKAPAVRGAHTTCRRLNHLSFRE